MVSPDLSLPDDGRLYRLRHYQSVLPLPTWGDLGQWQRARPAILAHLWRCTGLNAQTAAFAARGVVEDVFEHEGLLVENVRIETLPGVFVVGNLYRPKNAPGPLPLVLNPHGHAMQARTVPLDLYSVPHRAMNQALMGCAAFAYSMIGYDHDAGPLEHGTLLRGAVKRRCNALGLSQFGLQLNNSIKALDYLCSRPEIDASRVGCTGESGGGTQTYFLAAVDERVKVAAPAVMLSGHFQGGCVCENAPLLHLEFSNLHYAALIAPRPLLLLGCTGDWTHHLRTRELPCLRQLYALYDREEALGGFFQDEAHNYDQASREQVYTWMRRWLQQDGQRTRRVRESRRPVPAPERLRLAPAPAAGGAPTVRNEAELLGVWRQLHCRPAPPEETAAILGLQVPPAADLLVRSQDPHHVLARREGMGRIHYGLFSEDSSLRCRLVVPKTGERTLLLIGDWQDASQWQGFADAPPPAYRRRIAAGWGLLAPWLFGPTGVAVVDEARQQLEESYLFTTFNRTTAMHQAGDIVTTVRLAEVELGIAPRTITVVAEGAHALVALAAWAFLSHRGAVGPLFADLSQADPTGATAWSETAWFPLLEGAGGLAALAALAGSGVACLTGMGAGRASLPVAWRVRRARADLAGLLRLIS